MKIRYSRIFPTKFQLICLLVLAVALITLGNAKQMLDHYGLRSSGSVIKDSAGSALTSGLSKIDKFNFTGPVVTFAIWAIIGIFCFSLVQGIARIYHEIEADKELSSNNYIHPDSFARGSFWHRVVLDFAGVFGCLSLIFSGLYGLLAYVLPTSLADARPFLLGVSLGHLGGLALGLLILYAGLAVFWSLLKLFINRHRLAAGSR